MVLGGGDFGRWLGQQWSLGKEMSAFIKETPGSFFAPSTIWGHSEETAVCDPGSELSPDTESACVLILDLLTSRTVKNKCMLCSCPVYGILL